MLVQDARILVTQHRKTTAYGKLYEFDRAVGITVHLFLQQRFLLSCRQVEQELCYSVLKVAVSVLMNAKDVGP